MNPREITEKLERELLSDYACKSADSNGRRRFEASCEIRTAFQRDRDRIIHSKAFRRLMHKTQVFIPLEPAVFFSSNSKTNNNFLRTYGDHFRTRLTHTLEVAQIARTLARSLRLNEDLTEAIALAHDLGHSPFGHDGEAVLNELLPGFFHNEQSVRVVEKLEKRGLGLNLTTEVIDGILNHSLKRCPATLEGQVVRLSDKIAFINHDIDDAIRAGVLCENDLPQDTIALLGTTKSARINSFVHDTVETSCGKPEVTMRPVVHGAMLKLYKFMFDNVYYGDAKSRQYENIRPIILLLFEYFSERTERLPEELQAMIAEGDSVARCVCDYIAGMTDRFAIRTYNSITGNDDYEF